MTLLTKVPAALVRHTVSRLSSKDSPAETGAMSGNNRQNVKWVEGVRGVASFFVVVTHLCRAWNYELWFPRTTEDASPQFLQLPWIRLPWQGRIGVTMFAFLTGYVCAIKPLRQAKSGNISGALTTLGKSAFRRPPRLIMPATIAMFLAWIVTQFNAFDIALKSDSHWLRRSSPKTNGGLDVEVPRLFQNFQTSWTFGRQEYDEHQWALLPLLQGAFLIYVLLFATIFMKFRMRVFTCFVLFSWYWWRNSPEKETFECQFLYGVILCDVGSDKGFRDMLARHQKIRRAVMITLLVLGCYVGSYPGERPDWALWSRQLTSIGDWIFPPGAHSYAKRWTAIGWDLMATGIWLSPTLQGIFSNKLFMWLGRNSFAVYLTHGTLLRAVLVRLIYGFSSSPFSVEKNDKDEPIYHWIPRSQNWFVWAFSIPIFFAILYTVAHLWTTYVDAWCARATKWLEDTMFEPEEDEKQGVAQMA